MNYQKAGGLAAFSDYYVSKYDGVLFDKSLRQNIVFSLTISLSTGHSTNFN
ncbi:MAG: hypothetical protein WDN75_06335 [Bacteroidota bacterium]